MLPNLARRDQYATELMGDPHCDGAHLAHTYAQFALVNAVLGGWRSVYRREIRPRGRRAPIRLLDIGCSGGDVPSSILGWAQSS